MTALFCDDIQNHPYITLKTMLKRGFSLRRSPGFLWLGDICAVRGSWARRFGSAVLAPSFQFCVRMNYPDDKGGQSLHPRQSAPQAWP